MSFLDDTCDLLSKIDLSEVEAVTKIVKGAHRVFTVGNGGGAAHAAHFSSDLRQMQWVDAQCVNNDVASVSALANDFTPRDAYAAWLNHSQIGHTDCLFVFSVGGGNERFSPNLCEAMKWSGGLGAKVVGIVGEQGGYLREHGTASILIPSDSTPQVEGIQSVLAHMIACS